MLAWEPSAAKVTKSYFRRLPALERVYQETKFSLFKLESQNQAKNIPWVFRVSKSKVYANRSRGF